MPSRSNLHFKFVTLGHSGAQKTYHPTKFQPDHANDLRDMRYQIFSAFGLGGLTPGPKFTKRGDDLADSEIYHPAILHRSRPTHTRDICYQNSCGQTNKQKSKHPLWTSGTLNAG